MTALSDTPASRAGLTAGDQITDIDGRSTKGMSVEDLAKRIKGPRGTDVALSLVRLGKPLTITVKRDDIHISAVQTAKMITPNIGYIRLMGLVSENTSKDMMKALKDLAPAKGIILDLRDNPGGFAFPGSSMINSIEIANTFLDGHREIVSTVDRAGYRTPAVSGGDPISRQALVILTNRGTAHAAEIITGALHDNARATLVGERTFGLGLIQGASKLEDRSGVNVTIAVWLTPNCTDINRKGITPDIEVSLTEKDYKEGRGPWWLDPADPVAAAEHRPEDMKDSQLLRAIDVLDSKLGTR